MVASQRGFVPSGSSGWRRSLVRERASVVRAAAVGIKSTPEFGAHNNRHVVPHTLRLHLGYEGRERSVNYRPLWRDLFVNDKVAGGAQSEHAAFRASPMHIQRGPFDRWWRDVGQWTTHLSLHKRCRARGNREARSHEPLEASKQP